MLDAAASLAHEAWAGLSALAVIDKCAGWRVFITAVAKLALSGSNIGTLLDAGCRTQPFRVELAGPIPLKLADGRVTAVDRVNTEDWL